MKENLTSKTGHFHFAKSGHYHVAGTVFSNFTAEDIDLRRTNARGVVALKSFLAYAKDRSLDIAYRTGKEPESPFEEEVIKALRGIGYQIEPQVGSAGFRVDIGVIDEGKPGRYLLGIECDGAKYHSSQSARDRDRLRQEVLKGLGWKIHRIWSTDWFRDPKKELERVVEAIEKAKVSCAGMNSDRSSKKKESIASVSIIERTNETKQAAPMGFEAYWEANIDVHLGQNELHTMYSSRLANLVKEVVAKEGPVHKEIIIKRITKGAGLKRAGNRIRVAIQKAIRYAVRNDLVRDSRDGFIWGINQSTPPPRDRSYVELSERKLEMVAKQEIKVAFEKVIYTVFSIKYKDAVTNVLARLGFRRVTADTRKRAELVLNECIDKGKITRNGDFLSLRK